MVAIAIYNIIQILKLTKEAKIGRTTRHFHQILPIRNNNRRWNLLEIQHHHEIIKKFDMISMLLYATHFNALNYQHFHFVISQISSFAYIRTSYCNDIFPVICEPKNNTIVPFTIILILIDYIKCIKSASVLCAPNNFFYKNELIQ